MRVKFTFGSFSLQFILLIFGLVFSSEAHSAKLIEVGTLDRDYLLVKLLDGEVIHHEGAQGQEVIRYSPVLDTAAAENSLNWTLSSSDDSAYGLEGKNPTACYRKKKLNGHAQLEWSGSDFLYDYTYENTLYLRLPTSLQSGAAYQLTIGAAVNSDSEVADFTFDELNSRSEAIHVNLVGYSPEAPHKAADLYHWMGSGGPRNYSSFEGNEVYLYNVDTNVSTRVGEVGYWMAAGSDVHNYNLTGSDVWLADFTGANTPGSYRLVVEGVGCSQDFEIKTDIYKAPFTVSLKGYYYMRIGEENSSISPPPRTPLYIPGQSPQSTRVYLTTMSPFHSDWATFASGDQWDAPDSWRPYVKSFDPPLTNPEAWGGHSDAADWDRHLAHVANIYDMLLPYILTNGAIDDDDTGIRESNNGIPDLLDEARNEVDFWLRLRDGEGYSHGLTNPNANNELFQAGPTALAAWANSANAAMIADAFRIAGLDSLVNYYRDAAIEAYSHASGLPEPMLDEVVYLDEGHLRGRDLKMLAAAHLYNVTGQRQYEDVVEEESVCRLGPSIIQVFYSPENSWNQLYSTAAYLITPQTVHYPVLYENMKAQIITEAKSFEADQTGTRPSRRATYNQPSFWRTAHFVGRTIVAHAVTDDPLEKDYFRRALNLEADWGLGRNPMNMLEMTTASSSLASKRSVTEAYTSGRDDGVAGVHPGHTPYMNLSNWWESMVMAMPSKLYENSYPGDVVNSWPIGETYFPSRWVFAHAEFTPRQTMKGKMALYAYLYGLAGVPAAENALLSINLELTGAAGGLVSSVPPGIDCGEDCAELYPSETEVTINAVPEAGSRFAGWEGACFGSAESCTVNMAINRSVTARFEPIDQTYDLSLTITGSGGGRVTSSPDLLECSTDCSGAFTSGTLVSLYASADPGSRFTGWSGSCSGLDQCSFTMGGPRAVEANFASTTPPEIIIYDDTLQGSWENWSWGSTINLSNDFPVHEGAHSVAVSLGSWGGFSPSLGTNDSAIDTNDYGAVHFWIHGGSAGEDILFYTEDGLGLQGSSVTVPITANGWREVNLTLEQLGYPSSIKRMNFFNNSSAALSTFYLDGIRLVPRELQEVPGDVNGDGSADLADVIRSLQVVVGVPVSAAKEGDVNGDNAIGMEEAIYLLQQHTSHD